MGMVLVLFLLKDRKSWFHMPASVSSDTVLWVSVGTEERFLVVEGGSSFGVLLLKEKPRFRALIAPPLMLSAVSRELASGDMTSAETSPLLDRA